MADTSHHDLALATPLESCDSKAWARAKPQATVVVSSHNRAGFLDGLIEQLSAQRGVKAEVIIVDNGSTDDTWTVLSEHCRTTSLAMKILRLPFQPGPGIPRNTAITMARSELIAITDDDCLPTPNWLEVLIAGLDDAVIVQGKTEPEPGGWAGPWGRSISIPGPTWLFETANLGVRREAFLRAGGFPRDLILTGHPFGEDVVLGAAVARLGTFRFIADAVIYHRVLPATYRDFAWERRRMVGFPELFRRVPELDRHRFQRIFLGRRRAITDLGLLSVLLTVVLASVLASPWPLAALIGALPWWRTTWREGLAHPGRPRPLIAVQLMIADTIGAIALVVGSVRARTLLI